MTTYAFDIDGTLTKNVIRDLSLDLFIAGHTIYVITGGLARDGITDEERQKRIKQREKQLEDLRIKYHKLFVCIGKTTQEVAVQKADICKIYKIPIIFEDTPDYITAIERHSYTTGLLVNKQSPGRYV